MIEEGDADFLASREEDDENKCKAWAMTRHEYACMKVMTNDNKEYVVGSTKRNMLNEWAWSRNDLMPKCHVWT